MWQLLRDPMWQAVAAAITLLGILTSITLAVVVYLLQRRRKELGYRLLSQTRVVSVEAEIGEKVLILYEGQLVRDVHLVLLEVVNSGNQPIVRDDYQCPLNIGLGHGARVLTAELVESEPEGLSAWPVLTESPDLVHVHPLLLNPGDWFKLKMLVSEFGGTLDVSTRIVGVKEIRELPEGPAKAKTAITMVAAMVLYFVPIMVALLKGMEALLAGWWLGVFGWAAVISVVATVWVKWGTPIVNRYLRS